MKPQTRQQSIFRKAIGMGLISLSLVGICSLSLKEIPLALFGEHTTGVVKQVEVIQTSTASKRRYGRTESRSGHTTIMHLTFNTKEGKPMQSKSTATFHTEAKVGHTHPMIYLPSHPERAQIYSAKQLWLPMTVGVIFSTVTLLLGLRCLRDQPFFPSPKRLNAQGKIERCASSRDLPHPSSVGVDDGF